jgi:hypothetical protein
MVPPGLEEALSKTKRKKLTATTEIPKFQNNIKY